MMAQVQAMATGKGLALRGPGGTVYLSNRQLAAVADFANALQDMLQPDSDLEPSEDQEGINEREPDHDAEVETWSSWMDHPAELHIGHRAGHTDQKAARQ
jgi:hypothetical protein